MDDDFDFSNNKIYGLIGLVIILNLLFIFIFIHIFRNVDLAFDTIFTSIVIIIGMITIIIAFPVVTFYIWNHVKHWPIKISLSKNVLKFDFLILDDFSIVLKEITRIYVLRREDYYPWYDYFMIIKTKEQNLIIIQYLQRNVIKALFDLQTLPMVKINEARFMELNQEARIQKRNP